MKIYSSTEYIDNPTVGDLKLKVNSMWDFKSRSVCFQDIKKSFGVGNETISYDLEKCIRAEDSFVIGSNPPKPCKSTSWEQAEINISIKEELIKNGYILSNEYRVEEIPQIAGTLEALDRLTIINPSSPIKGEKTMRNNRFN
jgi:hypothetical protein